MKIILLISIFNGFLAVSLGAFGSHLLKSKLSIESMNIYEIANKYHFYHTLASISCLLLYREFKEKKLILASSFFQIGILFFSTSLYLLAITGIKILGAITPLGGLFFLFAWIIFFISFLKKDF